MKTIEVIEKLREKISNKPSEFQAVEDLFEMIRIYKNENSKAAHALNREVRSITAVMSMLIKLMRCFVRKESS